MNQRSIERKYIKRIIILVIMIILLWIISGFLVYHFFDNSSDRGTFGDMFGAINSLFSGLALAGVILTLIMQQQELKLQRQEIRQSTEELAGQKKALYRQIFESNFFNLLEIHKSNVENLRKGEKLGLNFFNNMRYLLMTSYTIVNRINPNFNQLEKIDIAYKIVFFGIRENTELKTARILKEKYDSIIIDKIISECKEIKFSKGKSEGKTKFGGRTMYLVQYFDHLYNLINYVKSYSGINESEKLSFIKIIKSQLSTPESCAIFFYVSSDYGIEWRESNIIEDYKLIEMIYFDNRIKINPSDYFDIKFKFYDTQPNKNFK